MISRKIYTNLIILIIAFFAGFSFQAEAAGKKFTVVIDAGHGGKDEGASEFGIKEKNINLQVALQLESLIKKKMRDAKVVMTRSSDEYLTLQRRAEIANKSQGDVFISIHTNSVDKKNGNRNSIEGSSVYTLGLHKDQSNLDVARRENSVIELEQNYEEKYSGFDPQRDESYIIFEMAQKQNLKSSISFAEDIEKELVKSGRKGRGVHQAGFLVLHQTSMPAVLVELDFICNPQSADYMRSEKGSKELAEAIFKALQKYESNWERNQKMAKNTRSVKQDAVEVASVPVIEEVELPEAEPTVKARTKTHTPSNVGYSAPRSGSSHSSQKPAIRRRRSKRSRDLSLANTYEVGTINLGGFKGGSSIGLADEELIASNNTKSRTKSKEEQKREKEELKRKKAEEKKQREAEKKLAKERKKNAHNAKVNRVMTVYKIQILASTDLLNQGNSRFCGLAPVTAQKMDNIYKYFYGESTNREDMETLLIDVKKKIPDAFIVSSVIAKKK